MAEPKLFVYTYQIGKRPAINQATAYGQTWSEALANIKRYHPKQINIKRVA